MKKIFIAAVAAASLMVSACGTPKTLDGKEYPTYGLFNAGDSMSEKVCYETSIGNVIWGILLIETLIAPVYFFGFSMYEPVSLKSATGGCGIDNT